MMQHIVIEETLRLTRYTGRCEFALDWYQDRETVRLVDGEKATPYDINRLKRMYEYLDKRGELYFIEVKEEKVWLPIGDVTFWSEDMPIVIGNKAYRGKGIGLQIVEALKKRAKSLGYQIIYVDCIYHYNRGSQKLFERAGFKMYKESEEGKSYRCYLNK